MALTLHKHFVTAVTLAEQAGERHSTEVSSGSLDPETLTSANNILRNIESFWLQQLGFGPRVSEFNRVETAA